MNKPNWVVGMAGNVKIKSGGEHLAVFDAENQRIVALVSPAEVQTPADDERAHLFAASPKLKQALVDVVKFLHLCALTPEAATPEVAKATLQQAEAALADSSVPPDYSRN